MTAAKGAVLLAYHALIARAPAAALRNHAVVRNAGSRGGDCAGRDKHGDDSDGPKFQHDLRLSRLWPGEVFTLPRLDQTSPSGRVNKYVKDAPSRNSRRASIASRIAHGCVRRSRQVGCPQVPVACGRRRRASTGRAARSVRAGTCTRRSRGDGCFVRLRHSIWTRWIEGWRWRC
jgi:hypothetical protein